MQLFLQQNGLSTTKVNREIDTYIPLRVDIEYDKIISPGSKYIAFESAKNSVEIKVGTPYGEIYHMSCINRNPVIIASNLSSSHLIEKRILAPLITTNLIDKKNYNKINKKSFLLFYNDCLLLVIQQHLLEKAQYKFTVNDTLSILTDNNYQIIAFLFDQLTEVENTKLKEFINFSQTKSSDISNIEIGKKMNLCLQQNIVSAILELKNIDVWEFLYDGLRKKIIDDSFIVHFSEQYLEAGNKLDLTIMIAGVLKNESNQILNLFEKQYPNYSSNPKPLYNDIWFYLCSLQDMYNKKMLC